MKTCSDGRAILPETTARLSILVLVIAGLLLSATAMAKPRPPLPPWPEGGVLCGESFDQPYQMAAGQWIDPSVWAESWSGYALNRPSQQPVVAPWAVPMLSTNGHWSIEPQRGALRLWYQPDNGLGCGNPATLVTLVSIAPNTAGAVWWSLAVSADGQSVLLTGEGANGPSICLGAPAAFESGIWYLLTLAYTETNSALFINDQEVATGYGLPTVPAQAAPFTGLIIGSRLSGDQVACGQIEEFTAFTSRPRYRHEPAFDPNWDVAGYYTAYRSIVALGPISDAEVAAQRAARLATQPRAMRMSPLDANEGYTPMDEGGGCVTGGPVYITNVVCSLDTNTGWTVSFTIAGGTNGVLYDVFGTPALTNPVSDSAWVRLTNGQACELIILTNQWPGGGFYLLGTPQDTDKGTLSDAYENLITHGNILDPSDDRLVPLVGIYATDSVAIEQQPTNTATFLVTRLGGRMNQSLTVGCQLTGTATLTNDYTLSSPPVTITPTNVLVTIPAGQTNIQITVTPKPDTNMEGSETVTLTLTTNVGPCELNPAHTNATVWILEEYTRTYTTLADFKEGVLEGLEAVAPAPPDGQLQFKTNLPPQFPFINVACSSRGTVARINTTNGMVVGEYRTAPSELTFTGVDSPSGPSPSRTTVDQYGNVWVANRDDTRVINGASYGSITRIGLIIGGTRYEKLPGGGYTNDAHGQYVSLADATYNTCIDRDGDGYIRTSSGLADILPWNNGGGVDSEGGVSTAEDEAITEYTRVPCTGTRTIAVDKFNDIWVGGHTDKRTHLKMNGLLGLPVPDSAFDASDGSYYYGGYGGVIDGLGNLWSSGDAGDGGRLLWLTPPANLPPQQGTNWQTLTAGTNADGSAVCAYGIAVDPLYPWVWQTSGGNVFRWHTNGTPETNGNVILYPHGGTYSQGLAVDTNGHVWVAHEKDYSSTVGHLDTNGTLVGVVNLQVNGLWAEYFANTNLEGWPLVTNLESPVDFSWTNGWPASEPPTNSVPANCFSARWSGVVQPQTQGDHVFYVSADAGAAFRLRVNGATIIDNWSPPATNAVELEGTNWLGTNIAYDLKLEYAHLAGGAQLALSWMKPGTTNKEVIPQGRFGPFYRTVNGNQFSTGPTGVSVDSSGKIWAGCWNSDTATRIDPNAGPLVVRDGQTNHVGLVDMIVDLGDGSWHTAPYKLEAQPYNYSDMTGLNTRVVNPGLKPLKGYWMVVNDSGNAGQLWNKVSWTAGGLTNGCSIEVYVRAADERTDLGSAVFVPATNNVSFPSIRGRFIEVRLAMIRDDPSKQPVLYDLTLYGVSSGFAGDFFLDDAPADEGSNAVFVPNVIGAGPMGYQWYVQYPWMTNMVLVPGATNSTFTITNVDSWVGGYLDANGIFHWTMASVFVTNANGESLWLGPAYLDVVSVPLTIPASGSSGQASRYPATICVFGQPTNLSSAVVSLWGLNHTRSADLNILLLSPSGKRIILMSNVGGTSGVSYASLRFWQYGSLPSESDPLPSGQTTVYAPSNYGQRTPQIPFGLPAGPYSSNLGDLQGDDPNGTWRLYIYDDVQPGGTGHLYDSWSLFFTFQ